LERVITIALEVPFGFLGLLGCESLTELVPTIVERIGDEIDRTHLPRLFFYTFFLMFHKFMDIIARFGSLHF